MPQAKSELAALLVAAVAAALATWAAGSVFPTPIAGAVGFLVGAVLYIQLWLKRQAPGPEPCAPPDAETRPAPAVEKAPAEAPPEEEKPMVPLEDLENARTELLDKCSYLQERLTRAESEKAALEERVGEQESLMVQASAKLKELRERIAEAEAAKPPKHEELSLVEVAHKYVVDADTLNELRSQIEGMPDGTEVPVKWLNHYVLNRKKVPSYVRALKKLGVRLVRDRKEKDIWYKGSPPE